MADSESGSSSLSRRQALLSLVASTALPIVSLRQSRGDEAAGATAAETAAAGQTVTSVRVVSANVRYGSADDGDNRWERRRDLLAEVLRSENADLIGTQEMLPFQAEFLRQNLNGYAYVGRSRELDNEQGEQCGIYYRKARFVQLEAGHFWLSPQSEQPGSQGWDAALPRMATWLKLFDRHANRPLVVVNTHFDHRGHEARRESAAVLLQFVNRFAGAYPMIVTGDFNCGEGSPPYQVLLAGDAPAGSPLWDVYRRVHATPQAHEGTFNGFQGRRDGPRIDWILATDDWQPMAARIVTDNDQGRYPSDHFPVFAELDYSSNPRAVDGSQ